MEWTDQPILSPEARRVLAGSDEVVVLWYAFSEQQTAQEETQGFLAHVNGVPRHKYTLLERARWKGVRMRWGIRLSAGPGFPGVRAVHLQDGTVSAPFPLRLVGVTYRRADDRAGVTRQIELS